MGGPINGLLGGLLNGLLGGPLGGLLDGPKSPWFGPAHGSARPFNGLGPGLGLSGFGRAKAHGAEPGPKRASGPWPFGDA